MPALPACRVRAPSLVRAALLVLVTTSLSACLSPAYVNVGDGRDLEEPKGDIGAILMDPVTYAVHEAFFEEPPRCISVMPFVSVYDETGAPAFTDHDVAMVRRAFYAVLAPSARLDVELERVDEILVQSHKRNGNRFRRAALLLGCDSYMVGTVTAYDNGFYGVYSKVEVGADVKVLRTRDGVELWRASHVAETHGGGLILSPFSMVTEILDASSNARAEQIHRVTADLARRLVATIPAYDGDLPSNLRIAEGADVRPAEQVAQRHRPPRALLAPQAKVVTASRVNVRAGPGKSYPVLQQMDRGTKVFALTEPLAEGWTAVQLANGKTGYVASPFVGNQQSPAKPVPAPVAPVIERGAADTPAPLPAEPAAVPDLDENDAGMGTLF